MSIVRNFALLCRPKHRFTHFTHSSPFTFILHRAKSTMEASWSNPVSGLWKPTQLRALYYGPDCVKHNILDTLPTKASRAFIISTSSLTKGSLLSDLEKLLGDRHAGTFSNIGQHAPVADLDKATEKVLADPDIDTVISVGGGSPIDSAKAISYRCHENNKKYLHHITIPTTLSAAECTFIAGYTDPDGNKISVLGPELVPQVVFYDATYALATPPRLWLSTGLRAMDHALETLYHPTASEVPAKKSALGAIGDLFQYLRKYNEDNKSVDTITKLQLASYASLGFIGLNVKGGLGLSHALGYALGSPYSIPHGITSCLTLGHVVKLKAQESQANAAEIARAAPYIGITKTGDDKKDADAVGQAVLDLVEQLGLKTSLKKDHNVGEDQVPVITKAATRQESGPMFDSVSALVKTLY